MSSHAFQLSCGSQQRGLGISDLRPMGFLHLLFQCYFQLQKHHMFGPFWCQVSGRIGKMLKLDGVGKTNQSAWTWFSFCSCSKCPAMPEALFFTNPFTLQHFTILSTHRSFLGNDSIYFADVPQHQDMIFPWAIFLSDYRTILLWAVQTLRWKCQLELLVLFSRAWCASSPMLV